MAESNPHPDTTTSDVSAKGSNDDEVEVDKSEDMITLLQQQMQKLGFNLSSDEEAPEQYLDEISIDGVVKYMKSDKCKNVIVLCGAGVSTSAGIPDFRSPETGLYHNLEKYDLPYPQAIFELAYFMEKPEPFFTLAKELYPGKFNPTKTHHFIKLLEKKNYLHRVYTQNIDTLERCANINSDKIVEAHGTFHTSHCTECKKEYSQQWMKDRIMSDTLVARCTESECEALVKPDIVFFGEALPERFAICAKNDFNTCDLLIILGTSLNVQPFASLPSRVPNTTPRLLINLEKAGESDPFFGVLGLGAGLDFSEKTYRDVFWEGNCDDGCEKLASLLGWQNDFNKLFTPPPPAKATPKKSTQKSSPSTSKNMKDKGKLKKKL